MKSDKIVEGEKDASLITNLHSILKPFLLRRIKSEVAPDLGRKIEIVLFCPLVEAQKALYKSVLNGSIRNDIVTGGIAPVVKALGKRKRSEVAYDDAVTDDAYFETAVPEDIKEDNFAGVKRIVVKKTALEMKAKGANQLKLQNVAIQLRKVCNHPLLFDIPTESLDDLEDDLALGHTASTATYSHPEKNIMIDTLPAIVSQSGKMLMLERILPRLLADGHKVLIFSQMTKLLDIISDHLDERNWPFCRIDGAVKMHERQQQIAAFQEGDVKIFLLSTRSGMY